MENELNLFLRILRDIDLILIKLFSDLENWRERNFWGEEKSVRTLNCFLVRKLLKIIKRWFYYKLLQKLSPPPPPPWLIIDAASVTGRLRSKRRIFFFFSRLIIFPRNKLADKKKKQSAFFAGCKFKNKRTGRVILANWSFTPSGIQDACLILNAYARACMPAG